MDSIEQASALINATRAEKSNTTKPTQTTTISGKATSDSAGGKVMVNLGGDSVTYGGVQDIEVNASINVKKGDSVRITLVGADGTAKDPMVTDVVGGGDRQQAEINKHLSEMKTIDMEWLYWIGENWHLVKKVGD